MPAGSDDAPAEMCHLQLQMPTKATTCNGKFLLLPRKPIRRKKHLNEPRQRTSANIINNFSPARCQKRTGFGRERSQAPVGLGDSRGDKVIFNYLQNARLLLSRDKLQNDANLNWDVNNEYCVLRLSARFGDWQFIYHHHLALTLNLTIFSVDWSQFLAEWRCAYFVELHIWHWSHDGD